MKGRYEIRDGVWPQVRGMRFTNLADAVRELEHAVPAERWFIWDRQVRARVGGHYDDHA